MALVWFNEGEKFVRAPAATVNDCVGVGRVGPGDVLLVPGPGWMAGSMWRVPASVTGHPAPDGERWLRPWGNFFSASNFVRATDRQDVLILMWRGQDDWVVVIEPRASELVAIHSSQGWREVRVS